MMDEYRIFQGIYYFYFCHEDGGSFSSETKVNIYHIRQRHISEDNNLNINRREKLKSHVMANIQSPHNVHNNDTAPRGNHHSKGVRAHKKTIMMMIIIMIILLIQTIITIILIIIHVYCHVFWGYGLDWMK
jgi:hypothetical protein